MAVVSMAEFDLLPTPEKLRILHELWARIADDPEPVPVDDELGRESDRRLDEHRRDHGRLVSWDDAVRRIRGK